jgi:hypothetical protein
MKATADGANQQPRRCQDGGRGADRNEEGDGGESRPDGLNAHRRSQEARGRPRVECDQQEPERCDDERRQQEEEVDQCEPRQSGEPAGDERDPHDGATGGG